MAAPLTARQAEVLAAWEACGRSAAEAARRLGVRRSTVTSTIARVRERGLVPPPPAAAGATAATVPDENPDRLARLESENAALRRERKAALQESASFAAVRDLLHQLGSTPAEPPVWIAAAGRVSTKGVVHFLQSDWHVGEVVSAAAVEGRNAYDLAAAERRVRLSLEKGIMLCFGEMREPRFDGVVVSFLGDMITGDLHEELLATNAEAALGSVIRVAEMGVAFLTEVERHFPGRVFVPCVTGNHGRTTRKPRFKERAGTNLDWLAYQMMRRIFAERFRGQAEHDWPIRFYIPEGPDARFNIYGWRVLQTHGDRFRGGDGHIGPPGPMIRGRGRMVLADAAAGERHDLMCMGHFHLPFSGPGLEANGSPKGVDEYAFGNAFPDEGPSQTVMIHHPDMLRTHRWVIRLDDKTQGESAGWVSWPAQNQDDAQRLGHAPGRRAADPGRGGGRQARA